MNISLDFKIASIITLRSAYKNENRAVCNNVQLNVLIFNVSIEKQMHVLRQYRTAFFRRRVQILRMSPKILCFGFAE